MNLPSTSSYTATQHAHTEPNWCVLVLWADDTEHDLKGVWGPYTDYNHAEAALEELRQWPLDGRWDVRRLNKLVAHAAGNPPNSTQIWSWGNPGTIRTTN